MALGDGHPFMTIWFPGFLVDHATMVDHGHGAGWKGKGRHAGDLELSAGWGWGFPLIPWFVCKWEVSLKNEEFGF